MVVLTTEGKENLEVLNNIIQPISGTSLAAGGLKGPTVEEQH